MLALAGAAIGTSRTLGVKDNWLELPAIYLAVIGPPGSAKSPAFKTLAGPLYQAQASLVADYQSRKSQFDREYAQYLKDWEQFKSELEGIFQRPVAPVPPVAQRLIAADITTAAVVQVLHDCPRGLLIVQDDMAEWLRALIQGGRGGERQVYAAAWAGEPICVDRKSASHGPIQVPMPFLCIAGGLTPEQLPMIRAAAGGRVDGFLDRFLFVYPEVKPAGKWNRSGVSEACLRKCKEVLEELRRRTSDEHNQAVVRLSPDGEEAWSRFFDAVTDEVSGAEFPECLRPAWLKMKSQGARLALILHDLWGGGEMVEAASVERAGRLVNYFQEQARKVYACMEADPVLRKARRLLRWMHARVAPGTTFGKAEAYRENRAHFSSPKELDRPLQLLQELRHIRPVPWQGRNGPGRTPTPLFEVNPLSRGGRGE